MSTTTRHDLASADPDCPPDGHDPDRWRHRVMAARRREARAAGTWAGASAEGHDQRRELRPASAGAGLRETRSGGSRTEVGEMFALADRVGRKLDRLQRSADAARGAADRERKRQQKKLEAMKTELAEAAEEEQREAHLQTYADAARMGVPLHRSAPQVRVTNEPTVFGGRSERSYFRTLFAAYDTKNPNRDSIGAKTLLQQHSHQLAVDYQSTMSEGDRKLVRDYFEASRSNRRAGITPAVREEWRAWLASGKGEFRADSTAAGSLGSLVPPVYLLRQWQLWRTASAPVASQATQADTPSTGMTIDIPLMTSAVTMSAQATENTAISSSSPTATYASVPVQTVSGAVPISQQTLDRFGPGVQADEVIADQAARQAATTLDILSLQAILNGGVQTIVNTASSPSIAQLWADVGKAKSLIANTEGTRLAATHTFLTSTFSAWAQAQVDSEGHPIWTPAGDALLARVGEVNTRNESFTGYSLLGTLAFDEAPANFSAASAGFQNGLLVGDVPNGLLVFTSTPIVDVHPEYEPAQLTAIITIRSYVGVAVLYPSAFCAVTGPNGAYPSAPTFTNS